MTFTQMLAVTSDEFASFAGDPNVPSAVADNDRPENPEHCRMDALQQPVMRIEIPGSKLPDAATVDGYFKLRPWQERCLAALPGKRNWTVNAPMASGKTFEICVLAVDRLERDSALRVIIAVPQKSIAAGFRHNRIEMPDGQQIDWEIQPQLDLCSGGILNRTAHLQNFLSAGPSKDLMGRVALCTHSTLVRTFAKAPSVFRNVLIVFDAAHHIRHRL